MKCNEGDSDQVSFLIEPLHPKKDVSTQNLSRSKLWLRLSSDLDTRKSGQETDDQFDKKEKQKLLLDIDADDHDDDHPEESRLSLIQRLIQETKEVQEITRDVTEDERNVCLTFIPRPDHHSFSHLLFSSFLSLTKRMANKLDICLQSRDSQILRHD